MADIIKAVSSAFASTKDTLINYHIVEAGASSLLTGIYNSQDDVTTGFYKAPDITGGGTTTKLALIYGEVMITPYLIDAGVSSSTNDPASIVKTYRFVAGDGTNGGVVTGPNGSPLENVYIKDPNGVPQPVINSDGKPSMGTVVLASALGGLISSAPKIWDALTADPAAPKIGTNDPITGKTLPSATQQIADNLAKQIPLGKLTNVSEDGKADNYILAYNSSKGIWEPKSINVTLQESGALGSMEICGGAGGSGGGGGAGGSGGKGGKGGTGGTPGATGEEVPPVAPITSFVEYPCLPAPTPTIPGMVLLPTLVNTANNEYTQSINVIGTKGIELHFHASGNGYKAIWKESNGATPSNSPSPDRLCLTDPQKAEVEKPATSGASAEYMVQGEYFIKICITANICGTEYLIYSDTHVESSLSRSAYTFTAPQILWADTKLAGLLAKYPGQIFTAASPNVKLYLSRTDACGSEYDLHFEGYKRLIGDIYRTKIIKPKTSIPNTPTSTATPRPTPPAVKADDGKFPDQAPSGGGMGVPSCPEPTPVPGELPTPGDDGAAGAGGHTGSTGGTGAAGTCSDITIATPKPNPSIVLTGPCAKSYGTQTTPPAFDAVTLPVFKSSSGITDQLVQVLYSITDGNGVFSTTGTIPGTVTTFPGDREMLVIGPRVDVDTASGHIQFTPANGQGGTITYTVTLTNADGTKCGTGCTINPTQTTVENNISAGAKICVDTSSTGGTGKIKMNFFGKTKDLTDGFVAWSVDANTTAGLLAANINANVAIKHALAAGSDDWLPAIVAVASTNEVKITAPSAGADEFNGSTLLHEETSGFVFDECGTTFLGGLKATVNNFLKTSGLEQSKLGDVLMGVGGSVIGAVITNAILNNASQLQISIPTTNKVDICFLYHGRIVAVPNEYDAVARTGHPIYSAFSGTWKQSWTQNPAWCLYDYITNQRYGLGNLLTLSTAQRTALLQDLFELGKYCDEIVLDINGANQPRFSLNTVITEGTRLQILQQLCSVFYGSYIFNNGGIRITYDHAVSDINFLVTQANANSFEKVFSSGSNFTNKVRLSYVEPSNFYTTSIVVAEDTVSIATYGERAVDLVAFGCTNASQAQRYAKWILDSEFKNKTIITYNGGVDHYNLLPGQIVEFHDSNEYRVHRGGRIISNTGTAVVLDAASEAVAGDYFSLTLGDGTVHKTTIASITGVNVVLTAAPSVAALPYSTWVAMPAAFGHRLYKVIKVDEKSNSQFNVTLQLFDNAKFA